MPLWIWLLGLLWVAAAVVVWSALRMASLCDDAEDRAIREELARREAIGRVVEDVRRPEHGL